LKRRWWNSNPLLRAPDCRWANADSRIRRQRCSVNCNAKSEKPRCFASRSSGKDQKCSMPVKYSLRQFWPTRAESAFGANQASLRLTVRSPRCNLFRLVASLGICVCVCVCVCVCHCSVHGLIHEDRLTFCLRQHPSAQTEPGVPSMRLAEAYMLGVG